MRFETHGWPRNRPGAPCKSRAGCAELDRATLPRASARRATIHACRGFGPRVALNQVPPCISLGRRRIIARRRRRGFTLVEVILVLVVIGVLAGFALPAMSRIRTRAAIQNGRAAVASALATARSAATRWGRSTVLRIDVVDDVVWVVVDTSFGGSGGDTLVLGRFDLRADMGLDLASDRAALCFDSRGVGTTGSACPATGARLILRHGGTADTLLVNAAGRLW